MLAPWGGRPDAVAGTVLSAASRPTPSVTRAKVQPSDALNAAEDAGDPAQLLASLRAVRKAPRLRKKQRRREAKQAAQNAQCPAPSETQLGADVSHAAGTAGQSAELGGVHAAVPAPVPESSLAAVPPTQTSGLTLQQLPPRGQTQTAPGMS